MTVSPEDLLYSQHHIWVKVTGTTCRIGITDFAQEQMGEIIYVDLPQEGLEVVAEMPFMEIESSKVISEICAPVDGVIMDVNRVLAKTAKLINESPYEEGWLVTLSMRDQQELGNLMNLADYEAMLRERR